MADQATSDLNNVDHMSYKRKNLTQQSENESNKKVKTSDDINTELDDCNESFEQSIDNEHLNFDVFEVSYVEHPNPSDLNETVFKTVYQSSQKLISESNTSVTDLCSTLNDYSDNALALCDELIIKSDSESDISEHIPNTADVLSCDIDENGQNYIGNEYTISSIELEPSIEVSFNNDIEQECDTSDVLGQTKNYCENSAQEYSISTSNLDCVQNTSSDSSNNDKYVVLDRKLFLCPACNKNTKKKEDMLNHFSSVHKDINKSILIKYLKIKDQTKWCCLTLWCSEIFETKTLLQKHINTFHLVETGCKEGNVQDSNHSLKDSMLHQHPITNNCNCCESDQNTCENNLCNSHENNSHLPMPVGEITAIENNTICMICYKVFSSEEIVSHFLNIHDSKNPVCRIKQITRWKCNLCVNSFVCTRGLDLAIHVKKRHVSFKNNLTVQSKVTPICSKGTQEIISKCHGSKSLKVVYICPGCHEKFDTNESICKHIQLKHTPSQKKIYLDNIICEKVTIFCCNLCEDQGTFQNIFNLKGHYFQNHASVLERNEELDSMNCNQEENETDQHEHIVHMNDEFEQRDNIDYISMLNSEHDKESVDNYPTDCLLETKFEFEKYKIEEDGNAEEEKEEEHLELGNTSQSCSSKSVLLPEHVETNDNVEKSVICRKVTSTGEQCCESETLSSTGFTCSDDHKDTSTMKKVKIRRIHCLLCKSHFSSQNKYEIHFKTSHPIHNYKINPAKMTDMLRCCNCKKIFDLNLKNDNDKSIENKRNSESKQSKPKKKRLKRNKNIEMKRIKCMICMSHFGSRINCIKHFEKYHADCITEWESKTETIFIKDLLKQYNNILSVNSVSKFVTRYFCPKCKYHFSSISICKKHIKMQHPADVVNYRDIVAGFVDYVQPSHQVVDTQSPTEKDASEDEDVEIDVDVESVITPEVSLPFCDNVQMALQNESVKTARTELPQLSADMSESRPEVRDAFSSYATTVQNLIDIINNSLSQPQNNSSSSNIEDKEKRQNRINDDPKLSQVPLVILTRLKIKSP